MSDRGSHIEADLGPVILGCVALLAILVVIKTLRVVVRTQWWEDHSWPLDLVWCRIKAAFHVLRGQPAWRCELCRTPVALEHDCCRRCTLALREAFRRDQPYDVEKGGL